GPAPMTIALVMAYRSSRPSPRGDAGRFLVGTCRARRQSVEEDVEQGLGVLLERESFGFPQPATVNAAHVGLQCPCRGARRHRFGEVAALARPGEELLEAVQRPCLGLVDVGERIDRGRRLLQPVQQHGVHPLAARIARKFAQRIQAQGAQGRQGSCGSLLLHLLDQLVERQAHPHGQRVEDVGLVAEVPVDGAAGHAGMPGDLLERGIGVAALEQHLLGGIEQELAGGARLGACPPGHGDTISTTYMRVCMLAKQASPGRPVLFAAVETRMDRTGLRRRLARGVRPARALRGIGATGALLLAGTLLAISGCSDRKATSEAPPKPPPVVVSTMTTATTTASLQRIYPARVRAVSEVEVRAQVSGIHLERKYREGARVAAGTALLVSDRQYDEARSAFELAQATLATAEASRRTAAINLGYTRVVAPIAGVTGLQAVAPGNLVEPGALLTAIRQLDPVHVLFSMVEADALAVRRQFGILGAAERERPRARILLPDGSAHEAEGEIDFVAANVDDQTGTVQARAVFPNPDGMLVPGQFVRISVLGLVVPDAIVVPSRAVVEGPLGPTVYVVGENGLAQARPVKLGASTEEGQVIEEGLKPGERIVVGGIGSVRAGVEVREGQPADDGARANEATGSGGGR